MKIWAVANQKGGVGKTTTAVSLAGHLAQSGKRTLLVDFDPQGSMTSYFRLNPDGVVKSVYNLFETRIKQPKVVEFNELARGTDLEKLFLLPASTAMATLDRQLGSSDGMGLVLSRQLENLDDEYEHVIIDCPPMLGILMVNALAACQHLIIPVQTDFLALKGLQRMMHTLDMIGKAKGGIPPYTIVPTFFDRRTRASAESLRSLKDNYEERLWPRCIPVDTKFREASRAAMPISVLSDDSRGSEAYGSLLKWLLNMNSATSNTIRQVAES
ncbi:MAG: ParA family protein [Gammaproteobacteria bacterium]